MDDSSAFRWVLDVNCLWPNPPEASQTTKATDHWATGEDASQALKLLTPEERAKVLRFYRPSDARLSLASSLLKHLAIVKTCDVTWSEAIVGEDRNKKPCYKPNNASKKGCEFNVSHHGTLVALAGCTGNKVNLGVDVVQINWERDYQKVIKDGFEAWANIYEMVFSERELKDIAGYVPPAQLDSREEIRAKLRHFYAHWCLKEAYVKMTGEALLSDSLKQLEFRNVQVPMPRSHLPPDAQGSDEWGQVCTDVEIWFRNERVNHIKLVIQAFREDYMIATASSSTHIHFSEFKELNLENDVYPSAEMTHEEHPNIRKSIGAST
ncbi:hypothetical protein ACLMJK_005793 [Lecanora helva]